MNNSADDRAAEQAGGDIPSSRVNFSRGRRQQSFKRLRTFKSPHRVFSEQSTQDFSITENNVTDEETSNHQQDKGNLKEQRDLVSKANQCANQCAADAFIIARLERGKIVLRWSSAKQRGGSDGAIKRTGKRRRNTSRS